MLDLFGIVTSGLVMLFVMFRAMQLDAKQPWFQRLARKPVAEPVGRTAKAAPPSCTWRGGK